jgi:hypothetical protein
VAICATWKLKLTISKFGDPIAAISKNQDLTGIGIGSGLAALKNRDLTPEPPEPSASAP